MLKLKYMFENYELAKCVLENWEYNKDNLPEYLKYFRISSNAVYPFESQGKRCFLRLSPVEEKQKENLVGELEFLQYLRRAGYPAMKPVEAKTGEFLLILDTAWGGYYASVFEGCRVLHKKDGRCHVIDFEDGMYHFFLLDIEQALEALSEELEGNAFEQAKQAFLKGYESEKSLEPGFEQKLPLMRRFCNVFSYARLVHCTAENVPDAPEWMVNLQGILARKMRSLEACMKK